jgi:hypothetical protein
VNKTSEGFNIFDGKISFISFFIFPLLAVKIFGVTKKQKRPQRDTPISMKALLFKKQKNLSHWSSPSVKTYETRISPKNLWRYI